MLSFPKKAAAAVQKCKKGSVCHKISAAGRCPVSLVSLAAKMPGYKMDARVYARASRFKLYQAFFTVSTRAAKLLGSLIAISDSILRFSSMPAFFRPAMKVE